MRKRSLFTLLNTAANNEHLVTPCVNIRTLSKSYSQADDFFIHRRSVNKPKAKTFHTSGAQSPGIYQKERVNPVCSALPQLEVPEQNVENVFIGMSTEFPCLTKNKMNGPEPEYDKVLSGYKKCHYPYSFPLKYNNARLPELNIAYETWGKLNESKSNAVMIQAGLSASSHAKSHKENFRPGWWEKFVGPGCAVDTNEFFVICPNNLGSCYGTTGPSSTNPLTGQPYATTFPIISVDDMVNVNFLLLDHLGIDTLHACVGSSLGGMLSLMAASMFPERVGREIATLTYRSGPEWDERFNRQRIDPNSPNTLCPTFLIESYLEHQGESFSTKYDPNSLLYISKAMDLFDMSEGYESLQDGLSQVKCPAMVIGVQTDILFPIWQQRELAKILQDSGNQSVTFYELNSLYGHDTFLLDLNGVGAAVKGFLETNLKSLGIDRVKRENIRKKDRGYF